MNPFAYLKNTLFYLAHGANKRPTSMSDTFYLPPNKQQDISDKSRFYSMTPLTMVLLHSISELEMDLLKCVFDSLNLVINGYVNELG